MLRVQGVQLPSRQASQHQHGRGHSTVCYTAQGLASRPSNTGAHESSQSVQQIGEPTVACA